MHAINNFLNWIQAWLGVANKAETLGLLAVVLTAICYATWEVFKYFDSKQTISIQNAGLTLEQHVRILKAQEAKLRSDLERAHTAEKALINLKLNIVEKDLLNLQQSYENAIKQIHDLQVALDEQKQQNPEIAEQLFEEAKAALSIGDTSKAKSLFSKIESKHIQNAAQAAYQQSIISYNNTDWLEALTHAERALRYQPDNQIYLAFTARLYLQIQEAGKALDLYEKALKLATKNYGENSPQSAAAKQNIAATYINLNRIKDAELILLNLLKYADNSELSFSQLATNHNTLGYIFLLQSKYKQASDQFEIAINNFEQVEGIEHHDIAVAYTNLARAYELQNSSRAEANYIKAIESAMKRSGVKHPNTLDMVENYIVYLRQQGRDSSFVRKKYGSE